MPFGIRPSNVRVCHSTTRASVWKIEDGKWEMGSRKRFRPGEKFYALRVAAFAGATAWRAGSDFDVRRSGLSLMLMPILVLLVMIVLPEF